MAEFKIWQHPATRPRKNISKSIWEIHKTQICDLYRQMPLKQVMEIMREDHHFRATDRQYEQKLRKWGVRKNGLSRVNRVTEFDAESSSMSNTISPSPADVGDIQNPILLSMANPSPNPISSSIIMVDITDDDDRHEAHSGSGENIGGLVQAEPPMPFENISVIGWNTSLTGETWAEMNAISSRSHGLTEEMSRLSDSMMTLSLSPPQMELETAMLKAQLEREGPFAIPTRLARSRSQSGHQDREFDNHRPPNVHRIQLTSNGADVIWLREQHDDSEERKQR